MTTEQKKIRTFQTFRNKNREAVAVNRVVFHVPLPHIIEYHLYHVSVMGVMRIESSVNLN
jgi:hypothetical protein